MMEEPRAMQSVTAQLQPEKYNNSNFWVEFSVFSDGLDSMIAQSMNYHSTFPQFVDFPPEIRLKIWEYLIQPRVVTACCFERDSRLPRRRAEFLQRSNAPPAPALLHINREARAVGLAHYELTFSWKISALLSDTPIALPAQVWFNFALDMLYLVGELEAYDSYGFNSPMVYFLRKEDTRRVRHVACAFAELHYPKQDANQIFGCLWHIIDRFQGTPRLLLTVTPKDEEAVRGSSMLSAENIMQKIWNGWILGRTVTSTSWADKQIMLVAEEGLAEFLDSQ